MAYIPQVWVDDETEIDEDHMEHIEQGIKNAYNVSLIAISDTAPSECSTGDKYYNTTTKKIYVATATDTWSVEGETPLEDIFYVLFDDNTTYAWDGEDLISVGGGSGGSDDIVVIGSESDTTENTKLLVDTSGQETTLKHKDESSDTFVDTLSDYVDKKIEQATAKSFMVLTNDTEQTIPGDNVDHKYNFNTIYASNGNELTFNSTDHCIVVGAGVSYIEVSAQLYITNRGTNDIKFIYIYKNTDRIAVTAQAFNYDYIPLIISSISIPVQQGDKISVYIRNTAGNATISGSQTTVNNFLTVKRII